MSLEFEKKYRFYNGKTPLNADTFNQVFRDLDTRAHALELLKADWEAAIREVSDVGIQRINEVLAPALTDLSQTLEEVQALQQQAEDEQRLVSAELEQYRLDKTAEITQKFIELDALIASYEEQLRQFRVTDLDGGTAKKGQPLKNGMNGKVIGDQWQSVTGTVALNMGDKLRFTAPFVGALPDADHNGEIWLDHTHGDLKALPSELQLSPGWAFKGTDGTVWPMNEAMQLDQSLQMMGLIADISNKIWRVL